MGTELDDNTEASLLTARRLSENTAGQEREVF